MPPKSRSLADKEAFLASKEATLLALEAELTRKTEEFERHSKAELGVLRDLVGTLRRENESWQSRALAAETELRLRKEGDKKEHRPVEYVVDRPLEISTVGLIDRFRPMRMVDPPIPSRAAAREKIRILAIPKLVEPFTVASTRARIARGELSEVLFVSGILGIRDFLIRGMVASSERSYLMVTSGTEIPFCFRFDGEKWVDDGAADTIAAVLVPIAEVYRPRYEKVKSVALGVADTMSARRVRDAAASLFTHLRPMMDGLDAKTPSAEAFLFEKLIDNLRPILLI